MKRLEDLRIIFIGTPDFAAASLGALIAAGAQVVAVVTVPDKPAGRGQQIHTSPVKDLAVANNIPVLQPEKLKNPDFLESLAAFRADVQVVVAFRMLPEAVWNMPPLGTINVHASLLPQYRGAAPINHAIMNGETITGVTTFKLKHVIDTGNILMHRQVHILPEDNAGTLHDKLMHEGASLLVQTIRALADGSLQELPQDGNVEGELQHAPKIFTETRRIDWNLPAMRIHNFIRGLAPYPAAFTLVQEKTLKIYRAHYELTTTGYAPGTVQIVDAAHKTGEKALRFACADGWLYIDELQIEGKKRMETADFLRGFRL
jgi:methionyl-tRNA formyltransferase